MRPWARAGGPDAQPAASMGTWGAARGAGPALSGHGSLGPGPAPAPWRLGVGGRHSLFFWSLLSTESLSLCAVNIYNQRFTIILNNSRPRYTLSPGPRVGARSAGSAEEARGVRRTQLHSRSSRTLAAKPSKLPAEAATAGTAAATGGESSASVTRGPTPSPPRAGSVAGASACCVGRQSAAIANEASCSALSSAVLASSMAAPPPPVS